MPKVGGAKPAGGGGKAGVGPGQPAKGGGGKIGPGKPLPGGPPPQPGAPAPAGTPTPVINPFMTAEDIMAYSEAKKNYETQLAELDYNYATSVANTGYEEEQITKGAIQSKADTNWETAGRGLERSSIRDGDLFDIDATAEMRKRFLDTQLDTLKLNTEAQKAALNAYWNDPETGFMAGMQKKEVQNAQQASAGLPATTEPPPGPGSPAAGKQKGKGAGGKGGGIPAKGFMPQPPPKPKNPSIGPGQPLSPPKPPKVGAAKAIKGKLA